MLHGSEPSLSLVAELRSEPAPRRMLSTLSALSTVVALLLGIACVVWLRGPETAADTTVALLGPRAGSAPTAAVTGETRPLRSQVHPGTEADVGSDLVGMARSLLGRVSHF